MQACHLITIQNTVKNNKTLRSKDKNISVLFCEETLDQFPL